MASQDEKRRPAALNFTPARSVSTDSSSSSSSLKPPRTPRFAEATSVHSPVDARSPFADNQEKSEVQHAQPGDIGFGYINNRESVTVPMTPKSPLKSAMKVPGTPGRRIDNPLSPTFLEEQALEKREGMTEKEQARDLKIKTRVRMAKFALRGVNFSCSLIVLSMLGSSFGIFNATQDLNPQNVAGAALPPWAPNTNTWPQKLVLAMSCISLIACFVIFIGYCRGGHKRAAKVNTYYTLFAIGWFIASMILWVVSAAILQNSKTSSSGTGMWAWSCKQNKRAEVFQNDIDFALVCRLQNWTLICIVIEIVVETICVVLYSVVFYRYYTKRRLHKSMNMRDRARSDLYLAQLRSQSAPNTPGFGPKSPAFSQYALSPRFPPSTYRSLGDIEENGASGGGFTPAVQVSEPESAFAKKQQAGFKLLAPPTKAPSATPKMGQAGFTPSQQTRTPSPPAQKLQEHGPVSAEEPVYDAVPIPGAYAGAAVRSPPPTQTSFGHAR